MRRLPLPFGTTLTRYILNNPQSLVNLYPIVSPQGSKNKFYLKSREGLRLLFNFDEKILGMKAIGNYLYIATTDKVYKISPSWNIMELGSVEFSRDRRVYIAYDGEHMIFVGGFVYGYDDKGFRQLNYTTGDPLPPSTSVTFINYKFILNEEGTGRFYWSKEFSLDFDPTYFATAEGEPDELLGVISDGKKVYLFGSTTVEVWYDNGSGFSRIPGAFGPPGIKDFKTCVVLNEIVYYVGGDGVVYLANGMRKEKISNEYVEKRLYEENYIDIEGYAYYLSGYNFYCLNIGKKETLCFNLETKSWHRRKSPNVDVFDVKLATQRLNDVIMVSEGGNIYILDPDYYYDNGQHFAKSLETITLNNNEEYFTLNAVELEMKKGDIKEGDIFLTYSKDGRVFSNIRKAEIAGRGEYSDRVIWWRLGRHRDLTLNIFSYDAREFVINNLWGYVSG